ncbi:MAG: AraC family transcriptional regulator [bacterium]|nr:AraC family transcriptional regulator [bacterium]
MDYYNKIETAIDYIEENLTEKLTVEDVSGQVFSSKWHFQRIFRTMTGSSIYSYIRKRRLSEAAKELCLTGKQIIDVAFDYNYETPETFLREFKKEYGIVPSQYRKTNEHLLFERINIRNDAYNKVYESKGITWKAVVRKKGTFIGKKYRTTMQDDKSYIDIPAICADSIEKNIFSQIPDPLNTNAMNGVYTGWDPEENFDFLVGTFTHEGASPPKGYVKHSIAHGKYMQFTVYGNAAEKILLGWKYIYGTWFADYGYEHGDSDDFDLFDERFFDSDNPSSEIYISIK